ncbi:MAG: hypothetical protein GY820_03315 [Gammaproteobacteria bacterium]|nr:hypothetical protein [Gammaproteobacteria bacterium]
MQASNASKQCKQAVQAMQAMQEAMQANASKCKQMQANASNASKQTSKQLLGCGLEQRRKNKARLCANRAIFNLQFLTFFKTKIKKKLDSCKK